MFKNMIDKIALLTQCKRYLCDKKKNSQIYNRLSILYLLFHTFYGLLTLDEQVQRKMKLVIRNLTLNTIRIKVIWNRLYQLAPPSCDTHN